MSDHTGAALIYPMLPDAETLIADKGYDSDAFREALAGRGITPCIPPRAKRRLPATYCKTLYRQRHKVENMFAKLKDWPYLNALRPLRPHVLQRYLHRGNRHLLARSMSPDPSNNFAAVVLLALTCLTDVVALPTARFHRSTSEGFFAPGIEPMEINMDPKLQVPEALRNLAETNVDQAEKAFNGFLEAARKSLDLMQSANMPSPMRDIPKRSLDLTEKNMKAAFEHARKLALAKDLQEVLQLQTEFLKSQFVAAQEQMKQLGSNLSAKAGEMTSTGKAEGDTSGAEASEATPSTRRTKGDTSRT